MGKLRHRARKEFALCFPTDIWSRWSVTLHQEYDQDENDDEGTPRFWEAVMWPHRKGAGVGVQLCPASEGRPPVRTSKCLCPQLSTLL